MVNTVQLVTYASSIEHLNLCYQPPAWEVILLDVRLSIFLLWLLQRGPAVHTIIVSIAIRSLTVI